MMNGTQNFYRVLTTFGVIYTITLALPGICFAQEQETSYSQLLLEVLESRTLQGEGFIRILDRLAYIYPPPVPRFIPIAAFQDPNARSYLTNVLSEGQSWPEVPEVLQAYYDQQARCYAALSLGYMGGPQVYDSLVAALNSEPDLAAAATGSSKPYDVQHCAAYGLAYLGDPNAIDVLIEALNRDSEDKEKSRYISALADFRDLRAFEPIVEFGLQYGLGGNVFTALEYLLRTEYAKEVDRDFENWTYSFPGFPELGKVKYNVFDETFWRHWLNGGGQRYAKQEFDQWYSELKRLEREESDRDDYESARKYIMRKMVKGGVQTLPYIMEKIEAGEEGLGYALEYVTQPALGYDELGGIVYRENPEAMNFTTRAKSKAWWIKNRAKWLGRVEQSIQRHGRNAPGQSLSDNPQSSDPPQKESLPPTHDPNVTGPAEPNNPVEPPTQDTRGR